ncbi:MAG: hypothetical protein JWN14_3681, partial [Chthonomonadales bacterium]|nr:hypothetical protein [Chthonomonadales bacterium]
MFEQEGAISCPGGEQEEKKCRYEQEILCEMLCAEA